MPPDEQNIFNLYYVMDPMCSWCWAFRPAWQALLDHLDDSVTVRYVMGGLAPDSDAPMPEEMRQALEATWRTIENRTGTIFNYEYWRKNTPRRSTYPACRAAIAAGQMRDGGLAEMVYGIQKAYYLEARNPSLSEVLCDIAESIGLERNEFYRILQSEAVEKAFGINLELVHRMGVQGFPAIIALRKTGDGKPVYSLVSAGYCEPDVLLKNWYQSLVALGASHEES